MRLLSQKSREYKDKKYHKYWIVIPNKLIEGIGWEKGDDLEAEAKGENIIIKQVWHKYLLFDENRNRIRQGRLVDRDMFLEKSHLSKTKNENWDTEVLIMPIEAKESERDTFIYPNNKKKEIWFGMRKQIEKALGELI